MRRRRDGSQEGIGQGNNQGCDGTSGADFIVSIQLFIDQYGFVALAVYAAWSIFRRFSTVRGSRLQNIPGPSSHSILTGNLSAFFDPDDWEFRKGLSERYGQVVKISGLLGTPQLFVFDPVALHSIFLQDADAYQVPQARDGLISPFLVNGPRTLDFNNILNQTSLEMIGRAGLGCSFHPMIPGQAPQNEYATTIKELLPTIFKLGPLIPFTFLIPWKTLRRTRDLVSDMHRTTMELILSKKEAVAHGVLDITDGSKDIMSLLLKGNRIADREMSLTDEELVAQTGMIIQAGTDTTSSVLIRMFHLLCLYPSLQEALRAEILESPEDMNYEQLGSLPNLDAFVKETLRLYPPLQVTYRETLKDTILPAPIFALLSRLRIKTNTYGAMMLSNSNPSVGTRVKLALRPKKICGIYSNMMTFLAGQRSCIGFQFALLEMKMVLSVFLRHFRFSLPDKLVQWKVGLITVPIVDGETQLPLTVELLKD
ncbi:Cytochrome P450 [Mycena venus]|uniref:Cytochrome P450 n=1 Tax=Mycena venus TaxID=2733690 RepID=A0A8H6X2E3_9AGAR|nr:Cytochrome P450 [Mycena venus]